MIPLAPGAADGITATNVASLTLDNVAVSGNTGTGLALTGTGAAAALTPTGVVLAGNATAAAVSGFANATVPGWPWRSRPGRPGSAGRSPRPPRRR